MSAVKEFMEARGHRCGTLWGKALVVKGHHRGPSPARARRAAWLGQTRRFPGKRVEAAPHNAGAEMRGFLAAWQ